MLKETLNSVATAEPYIGRYFSQDYVRRRILRQPDEEILEQDKLIKKEIKDGTIPDPDTIDPETGLPLDAVPATASSMDGGAPVMEPDLESETMKPVELPIGGEI